MATKPVPDGYHTITPYLVVPGVAGLIEFLGKVLGAEVTFPPVTRPDGTVMHAELRVGDSRVMLGEPNCEAGPTPATLYVYLDDVDAAYQRAIEAGATSISEPADQFYGDRHGGFIDPSGNRWWVATHLEDVEPEELARRAAAHAARQPTPAQA